MITNIIVYEGQPRSDDIHHATVIIAVIYLVIIIITIIITNNCSAHRTHYDVQVGR